MDHVPPDIRSLLLPEGTVALEVAVDQPQYEPMVVLRTPDGRVVTQWRLTEHEQLQLLSGAPITLVLFCGRDRQQPVQLFCEALADLREEPFCPRCERPLSSTTLHYKTFCVFMLPERGVVRVYDDHCEL